MNYFKNLFKIIYNFTNILSVIFYKFKGIKIGSKSTISLYSKLKLNGGKICIGKNVTIHNDVLIDAQGGFILIGDNVSINPQTVIYGGGGVTIGRNTMLAVGVRIIAQNHIFISKDKLIKKQGSKNLGISIGDDVWLGANVIVLDSTIINNGSVCGAGSVVNRDTIEYSINVGNPCKTIGYRI